MMRAGACSNFRVLHCNQWRSKQKKKPYVKGASGGPTFASETAAQNDCGGNQE
jgi:hypothetical protein